MARGSGRRFLEGLGAGAAGTLVVAGVVIYLLERGALVTFPDGFLADPGRWIDWVQANLGTSVPVFVALFAAYAITLARLRRSLAREQPIERIVQLDHLTDTWTALFFGTGVIWTAIGMRGALLVALGDPAQSAAVGASTVLRRLVDGGILLALSTTIVGGIGGYLMRVYKSVTLGSELQRRYNAAARVDTSSMRDALHRIEEHVKAFGRRGDDS